MSIAMPSARHAAIAAVAVVLLALPRGVALGAPADLDPGFGQNGRLTLDSDIARALALQPDGKILVAGEIATGMGGARDGVVYRLTASGSLDGAFGLGGAVRLQGTSSAGYALALQPDGKALSVGETSNEDAIVFRLNGGGSDDLTFGQGGSVAIDSGGDERVYALALQPSDGKILVAGETISTPTRTPVVYRLTPGGQLDESFGQAGTSRLDAGGSGTAFALARQADGKILAAGSIGANDNRNAVVYRLNGNGTPDPSFGKDGKVELDEGGLEGAVAVALQRDGRILAVGSTADAMSTTADAIVYRLNPNGTLDASFGQGGKARIADSGTNVAYAVALQPDGKIVVAGGTAVSDAADAAVYRLNPDGSLDAGFDGDGALRIESNGGEVADALAIQPDGKVVIAGVTFSGLSQRAVLYRLQGGDPVSAVSVPPASAAVPSGTTSRPSAPVLTELRITPLVFRAAAKGPSALPAARRGGTLVTFALDRAASVRFAVERAGSGRRVGGRCTKPTRTNRAKRPCTRYTRLARGFTRRGAAGANRFRLTGRLGARRLTRGRYRLIATPTADRQRGERQRARFRIKG
jgi:uncharacterized delta-60 repeat protein